MHFDLQHDAPSRTMITAHRGVWGGNIPGNTIASFDIALQQGADMIELDISNASDGELFVFHPGMESVFLHSDKLLDKGYDIIQTDWPMMLKHYINQRAAR